MTGLGGNAAERRAGEAEYRLKIAPHTRGRFARLRVPLGEQLVLLKWFVILAFLIDWRPKTTSATRSFVPIGYEPRAARNFHQTRAKEIGFRVAGDLAQ